MPAAGPAAVERLQAAGSRFAEINASGTGGLETATPTGPPSRTRPTRPWGRHRRTDQVRVSADKTEALPELEDTLVALHLAVMAGRPWTQAAQPEA